MPEPAGRCRDDSLPPIREVRGNLGKVHNQCMEEYLVDVVAGHLGGYVNHSFEPEIDGIVFGRSGRPRGVVEVKWGRVKGSDMDRFIRNSESVSSNRYPVSKTQISREGVRTLLPEDVLALF